MPVEVKFRRGNTSQHSTFTGAEGELTVDTEKDTLVVHDGTTAGGFPVITALAKQSIIPSTNGTFSLGNTTNRWANLFLSGNTLVIGDQTISSNSTSFILSGAIFASGNVTFEDSTTQGTAWPGHITQIEGGSAVTVYDVQVAMIDGGHVGVVYAPSDDIFDGGNATSTYITSTDYKINGGES